MIDDEDRRWLRALYRHHDGKAWKPGRIDHPWLVRVIEEGLLERCPIGVQWTAAGHEAFKQMQLTRAEIEALRRIRDGIYPLKRLINNPSGGRMLQRMVDRGLIEYIAGWHRTPLGVAALEEIER